MTSIKDIFCKQYIGINDIRETISENDFRKFVGVSYDTFESKLGQVEEKLRHSSFKVSDRLINLRESFKVRENPNYLHLRSKVFIIDDLEPFLSPYSLTEIFNPTKASFDFIKGYSAYYLFSEYYSSLSEFIIDAATQSDSLLIHSLQSRFGENWQIVYSSIISLRSIVSFRSVSAKNECKFIASLREQYGDDWQDIYNKLIGLREFFSIICSIEKLLFDIQDGLYHNSSSHLSEYEYFDLMFTVKNLENYTQNVVVNQSFSLFKTSIQNENKIFRFN